MTDYLYDGSWQGFLTCVYYHYYEEKAAEICPEIRYQTNLLRQAKTIVTDTEKAERVSSAIERKISPYSLTRAYAAFLADEPDKERFILDYIVLGFRVGGHLDDLRGREEVFRVQKLAKQISREAERFRGLLRFSVLKAGDKEILYGKIHPRHNILELLGEHFSDRFRSEPFLIYDGGRGKALFGWGGNWETAPFEEKQLPGFSQEERDYRRLWQRYFHVIAIKERENPRCQKNFMPVRYWKDLPEFSAKEVMK